MADAPPPPRRELPEQELLQRLAARGQSIANLVGNCTNGHVLGHACNVHALANLSREGTQNFDWPRGTFLIEMLAPDRLRIEWFDTHEPVAGFTAGARVFER